MKISDLDENELINNAWKHGRHSLPALRDRTKEKFAKRRDVREIVKSALRRQFKTDKIECEHPDCYHKHNKWLLNGNSYDMPIQIDHIDGNPKNDRKDNLQGLCLPHHAEKTEKQANERWKSKFA